MRFLGNKESIKHEIYTLLEEKGLISKRFTLFDAFCGSGAVADSLKSFFNIAINDNLAWCVIYTKGRINAKRCDFKKLKLNPFEYLNQNNETIQGFFYNNYSHGGSSRMYFSIENAGRIDYFRSQIDLWKDMSLISEVEYAYLMACLIESVSLVSNTAGVYGAFLKEWDPRALKQIEFIKVNALDVFCNDLITYNDKIENIISEVDCDILYIDPPYTQNQYGTQYHLLETLVLNDSPTISNITGSRPVTPMRSDWSKEFKAHILFDKVISKTKAKHIILSYNTDGFMSKDFIEACMKRYGLPGSYTCKKISYKKYRNWKTKRDNEHFEYLFYMEKMPLNEVIYECPLNYIGSKAKMITEIRKHVPQQATKIIDAFGGGFNVGINLPSIHTAYNDNNYFVTHLIKSFQEYDTYEYLLYIRKITKKYGLEKGNAKAYKYARSAFNSMPVEKRDSRFLFTLILYGFQQQIRFNNEHEFNNPVGNRWFNDKVLEKMISFSRRIKEFDCAFYSNDFKDVDQYVDTETFVYVDPPYMLTCGAYNDGKRGFGGWTKDHEASLFNFLDILEYRKIPFMFSYVLENGGQTNGHINSWLKMHSNYRVIEISQGQGRYSNRKEVLIINDGQTSFYNKKQIPETI